MGVTFQGESVGYLHKTQVAPPPPVPFQSFPPGNIPRNVLYHCTENYMCLSFLILSFLNFFNR